MFQNFLPKCKIWGWSVSPISGNEFTGVIEIRSEHYIPYIGNLQLSVGKNAPFPKLVNPRCCWSCLPPVLMLTVSVFF